MTRKEEQADSMLRAAESLLTAATEAKDPLPTFIREALSLVKDARLKLADKD